MAGPLVAYAVTDAGYLTRLLALHESLRERASQPPVFVVYCLDDEALRLLSALAPRGLEPVAFSELEAADPQLLAVRPSRSWAEYSWTAKPSMALDVLARHPEAQLAVYLDADLRFFADPMSLFGDPAATQMLTPHRFATHHRHLAQVGTFNAGFVGVRRSEQAYDALRWWRERCLEWCHDRVEDGRYADQAYLDAWAGRFPGTLVIDDPGVNVGPWNWDGHEVRVQGEDAFIDDRPLYFVHYHGVRVLEGGEVRWAPGGYLMRDGPAAALLAPYARALDRAMRAVRAVEPGFRAGVSARISGRERAFGALARTATRVRRRVPAVASVGLGSLPLPGRRIR